jgi:hypothetical protein
MEETGRFLEVAEGQKQLPVSKSRFVGNVWVWEVARVGAVCIGPDWPYGVVVSVLLACTSGLYASVVIPSIPDQMQWLSWLLPAALVLSYLFLFLSNPGIPLSLLQGHKSHRISLKKAAHPPQTAVAAERRLSQVASTVLSAVSASMATITTVLSQGSALERGISVYLRCSCAASMLQCWA